MNQFYLVEETGTYKCYYLTNDPDNWKDRNVYIPKMMEYNAKKIDKQICLRRDKPIVAAIEKLLEKQKSVIEFI